MKHIARIVSTGFWEDPKVVNDFSPEDKYFMLYLLTNPHTSQLGIYQLVPKKAAFELGYSIDAVNVLLERFETKYDIIRYSRETSEIAIKNFLKYSVVKGGKPVMDCLLKEEQQVKDKSLLSYIYSNLHNNTNVNTTITEYLEHLNNTLSTNSINNSNDNDNDNENERIVDESLTNRQDAKEAVENLFEEVWKLYPKKKGKGQVSKKKKDVLFRIGYGELSRCIERYKKYIVDKGVEEQYVMHGSTFFNSGYVDYLDGNYEEPEPESTYVPPAFGDFSRRQ